MNSLNVIGRLVRDTELKTTVNGTSMLENVIAWDDWTGGQKTSMFLNFTVFGRQAETMDQYVAKGHQVALSGKLQIRSYDKKDGTKGLDVRMIVSELTLLNNDKKSEWRPVETQEAVRKDMKEKMDEVFDREAKPVQFDDGDLPF